MSLYRDRVLGAVRVAVLLATVSSSLLAQGTGTIRGRVIEAGTERPLADVQVVITGTTLGANTNVNGEFAIATAPAGTREVVARRLGFGRKALSVTVPTGGEVRADFLLSQAATQLEQIVVTGTAGSVERKTIGNSITTLDVAELTQKTTVMNVAEVLQAKSPGVTILPGSGVAGTAGEIRIRGSGSVSGYKPVVFIDGVRYNIDDLGGFSATGGGTAGLAQSTQVTSALNNLNPNDIESMEIIKGPAAATLYGAEAANGVIQIITKKGRRGQQAMTWNVRAERGTNEWKLLPEDNYTTCDAARQALLVTGDTAHVWPRCVGLPVNTVISGNPLRDDPRALRSGDLERYALSLRGGGDRYSFYLSGDRDVEQGVFFNSDNNRTSIRSNVTFNPNDKSDFSINVNWQDGRLRLPIQDESANGLLLSARRGNPGRRSYFSTLADSGWRTITPGAANRYKNFTESERLTLGGTVNVNPIRWWRNRFTAGFDNTTTQAQLLFLPGDIDPSQDPDAGSGANLRRTPTRRILTLDYAGSLLWDPTSSFSTTTSFGSQIIADKTETLRATGIGIGAVDVTRVDLLQRTTGGEDYSENNSVGYYVQEQVGFKDRLFVTGAVRADDHSSFGKNFDLIVYPKFSLSYVLSEEPAAKRFLDAAHVNSLKLRSAWGQAGRAPSAYSAPQTYTVDRVTLGANTGSALRTSIYGNPDLKPEKGQELEFGFDAGMLGDRMGIDFTYYDKKTTDMLQSISVPASTGFISSRLTNLGTVTNKGVEVSLYGVPVQRNRVSWETRLNLSTNTNRLVTFGVKDKVLENPTGQAYGTVQQHRPGYPLGGFWVTPPLRCGVDQAPAGAQPCTAADSAGHAAILTAAGAAIFNPGDTARRYQGSSTPTREIGFSNTITLFRHFRLYGLLDYKGGFNIFNLQERNRCQSNDNCWRVNNPQARFPQTGVDSVLWKELAVYRSSSISPEWIQKGDFIKLREVSLTLDLPQRYLRRTGASSANLVLSGRNLAVWSDYEGVDPEVNSYGGRNFVRVDAYAAPMMRRFSAAINLQF